MVLCSQQSNQSIITSQHVLLLKRREKIADWGGRGGRAALGTGMSVFGGFEHCCALDFWRLKLIH